MDNNYCVICGVMIPEGKMTCPLCEKKVEENWKKGGHYRGDEKSDRKGKARRSRKKNAED